MADRPRLHYRTPLLWLATLCVIGYALVDEYRPAQPFESSTDAEADVEADGDKLRIVSVKPAELVPGAAVFVHIAGVDERHADEVSVEIAKLPAEVLQRGADQVIVRVPSSLAYGQAKLRVLQRDRRSKAWTLTLRPLPRHEMLRNVIGGLALFVLGLRTMARSLRAYAGHRIRAALARLTRGLWRPAGLGVLIGLLTQSTTSAAGLFAGLLAAHMLKLRAAVILLIGAQLGAALAAVLLPLFATREALWVIAVGALWVLLAESRLSRALGSVVVGAGLIFHGLGLLQAGCAPLITDPQVVPYLSYLQAGALLGLLACAAAGAALGALLQGPSPVYALALSLLQQGVLGLRDALAILAGVSFGALINTFAAAWPFASDGRRLVRAHVALGVATTLVSLAGLPLWLYVAQQIAALAATRAKPLPALLTAQQLGLGAGFLVLQAAAALVALALVPSAMRAVEAWSLRGSLRPPGLNASPHSQALLEALALCEQGLGGVREIIASSDRSSAPATERALSQAKQVLRELLRATPSRAEDSPPPRAASVAGLHLADALLAILRVAEKAPELGLSPSGEGGRALEQLHELVDRALSAVSEQLAKSRTPSLTEAQAREIEINAFEAATRRVLFEDQSAREDLALRLWSSELCSAYETIGNQVYRLANAVGATAEDDS
jgi:Na+/phosphate symporter